jgi:predicted nucleic-acid-binding Zn-ribbon protein
MRNLRCPQCRSVVGKIEENKLILRTGYGSRQVFHVLENKGVLTCWNCKEIITIGENNGKIIKESRITEPEPVIS